MMMNEARAHRLQHGDSTKSLNREKQQNTELYTENERLKLQINEMTENCKNEKRLNMEKLQIYYIPARNSRKYIEPTALGSAVTWVKLCHQHNLDRRQCPVGHPFRVNLQYPDVLVIINHPHLVLVCINSRNSMLKPNTV
ncbi:uncharacterized protein [Eurosta solidaginis]|uniref:uncharacterized protein isoform X1 n=1 Tax=Eurosta solidaginis TaxID=178769 RepID=UPI003530F168